MALTAMNQILVVAAHPDDEVFGCSGSIASHAASVDQPHVPIIAAGSTARKLGRNRNQIGDEFSTLSRWNSDQVSIDATGVFCLLQ